MYAVSFPYFRARGRKSLKNRKTFEIIASAGEMSPNMAPARGITSQPSMSAKLMRAEIIPRGRSIWVEDEEDVWVLAEVVRQQDTLLTVRRKKTGDELEIDLVRAISWGERVGSERDLPYGGV